VVDPSMVFYIASDAACGHFGTFVAGIKPRASGKPRVVSPRHKRVYARLRRAMADPGFPPACAALNPGYELPAFPGRSTARSGALQTRDRPSLWPSRISGAPLHFVRRCTASGTHS
jgi:hypothetical protein